MIVIGPFVERTPLPCPRLPLLHYDPLTFPLSRRCSNVVARTFKIVKREERERKETRDEKQNARSMMRRSRAVFSNLAGYRSRRVRCRFDEFPFFPCKRSIIISYVSRARSSSRFTNSFRIFHRTSTTLFSTLTRRFFAGERSDAKNRC
jgi:hypothetical protein